MYRKPLVIGSMVVATLAGAASVILMLMTGDWSTWWAVLPAVFALSFGWLWLRTGSR